ncbi:hypothetical protein VTN00DRAFT_8903 [Thermoascus crustaceus]|uniref:uncharacterized protein n=1 Tax=Thermoascus crustaceus TaxID=5088 RepID=UPI003744A2DF
MDGARQHALPNIIQGVAQQSFQLRLGDWLVFLILGAIAVFRLGDGKLWGKPDPNSYMWYVAPQKSGDLKVRPKKTRDIGKRLQETGNDIAIFWGSKYGVSERFVERLSREWRSRFALKTLVADLDDYDPESSDFSEGETHSLSHVNVVDETLSELGSQRIGPVGRAVQMKAWGQQRRASCTGKKKYLEAMDKSSHSRNDRSRELSEKALYNIKERVAYNARQPISRTYCGEQKAFLNPES